MLASIDCLDRLQESIDLFDHDFGLGQPMCDLVGQAPNQISTLASDEHEDRSLVRGQDPALSLDETVFLHAVDHLADTTGGHGLQLGYVIGAEWAFQVEPTEQHDRDVVDREFVTGDLGQPLADQRTELAETQE